MYNKKQAIEQMRIYVTELELGDHKIRTIVCPDGKRYAVFVDISAAFYGGRKTKKALEAARFCDTLTNLGIEVGGVRWSQVLDLSKICEIFEIIPPISAHAAKMFVQLFSNLDPTGIFPTYIEIPETYGHAPLTNEPLSRDEIPIATLKKLADVGARQKRARSKDEADDETLKRQHELTSLEYALRIAKHLGVLAIDSAKEPTTSSVPLSTEDPAVAMHRLRQHEFSIIARKTVDYSGQLIAPCTCCAVPRACIFNSWIFYNDELKKWEAYCAACTDRVSVDRTLLKATYDILRVGTWFAQFGTQAIGECCACANPLDFWNFHRAHDIASSLLPDGTVDSIRNSFVSCQTCNLGTGIIPFSKVIVDTRAHLKLEPLRERSDSSMVLQGIAWMNDKNPVGMCPWNMGC